MYAAPPTPVLVLELLCEFLHHRVQHEGFAHFTGKLACGVREAGHIRTQHMQDARLH